MVDEALPIHFKDGKNFIRTMGLQIFDKNYQHGDHKYTKIDMPVPLRRFFNRLSSVGLPIYMARHAARASGST